MRYLVLALALMLTACGTRSDRNDIERQIDDVFAECERRAQAGELRTKVAEAQCQTEGGFRILEQTGSNDMDLMRLESEKRLAIAKRMDSGNAGPETLEEYEEFWSQIENEIERRDRLYGKDSRNRPVGNRSAGNCRIVKTRLDCVTP